MRWIGFVRNVMLGREGLHRAVLVGLFADAGGTDVRSHLTTGNVTFDAPDGRPVVDRVDIGLLGADRPPLDPAALPDPGRTVLLETSAHEVFTARPRAGGRRPHVVPMLERATGGRATARGWSTLQRIAATGG